MASITNKIYFSSTEVIPTSESYQGKKVYSLRYSVDRAYGYIYNSNLAYNGLLLKNYSGVCKNVRAIRINRKFDLSGATCGGFYIPADNEKHSVDFFVSDEGKLVLKLENKDLYFMQK